MCTKIGHISREEIKCTHPDEDVCSMCAQEQDATEWTVRPVHKKDGTEWPGIGYVSDGNRTYGSANIHEARAICDAHNASIAKERKIKSAEKLILLDEIAKNQQLRTQVDEQAATIFKMMLQLAAAQAAIKQIYKVISPCKELPATGKIAEILSVIDDLCADADTSALDAAIAEATKPLVDALNYCRTGVDVNVIDAALAKVKP